MTIAQLLEFKFPDPSFSSKLDVWLDLSSPSPHVIPVSVGVSLSQNPKHKPDSMRS
jgi:hypothetical protein